MESEPKNRVDRLLSNSLIWRLAQIVLVLAAALLYVAYGSFGGELQTSRLMLWPHTVLLVKAILIGLGIGVCIGLALKDLSSGRVAFVLDWPTLLISLVVAGFFTAVAISFHVAAQSNQELVKDALGAAVVTGPLLPFVWVGLALTTVLRARDE